MLSLIEHVWPFLNVRIRWARVVVDGCEPLGGRSAEPCARVEAGLEADLEAGLEALDRAESASHWLAAWAHLTFPAPGGSVSEASARGSSTAPANDRTAFIPLNESCTLDLVGYRLIRAGREILLTVREHDLLALLCQRPGGFLSAQTLAERLRAPGATYEVEAHAVEQTITGLRRKLGESAQDARVLVTRRGVGYALTIPGAKASE